MATVTNLTGNVFDKRGIPFPISRSREYIAEVAFGATENYATGGIAVDFATALQIKYIDNVVLTNIDVPGDLRYDPSTGKVLVFGWTGTTYGELPAASTAINSKKFRARVLGRV